MTAQIKSRCVIHESVEVLPSFYLHILLRTCTKALGGVFVLLRKEEEAGPRPPRPCGKTYDATHFVR